MRDVGVIYLYRFAEGEQPVRRFLQTYRAHPAGMEYDLHVIFKGFPDHTQLELGRALFDGISINAIGLTDDGYDIGAYVAAARLVSNRRVLFLNTFSQIQGDNWLRHFDRALNAPGIGLAGATGSWQSLAAGYERNLRALLTWLWHLPSGFHPLTNHGQGNQPAPLKMRNRSKLRYLLSPFHYLYALFAYGRHPNPHIRTNAFMVERTQFLSLDFPTFRKKNNAYRFESGRRSLTRQYIARGLLPVVVDRNGEVYEIDRWKLSKTFWIDDQVNLLVADNRTCDYAEGTAELREYLEYSAWLDPWTRT